MLAIDILSDKFSVLEVVFLVCLYFYLVFNLFDVEGVNVYVIKPIFFSKSSSFLTLILCLESIFLILKNPKETFTIFPLTYILF